MTEPDHRRRQRLFPTGIRSVQLYRDLRLLDADRIRCAEAGWQIIAVDGGSWPDADAMHDALVDALAFPAYYGRNLDALGDAMADVAEGRYGFDPQAPGGVLVIHHIDRFLAAQPRVAAALVEVVTDATSRALRFGWPLACFLQSDDPDIHLEPAPPEPIGWNPQEQLRTNR
ncbi:MAG: barstar family protein [Actinomycetota bacterium]